jgi:hypothetical protein
MKYQFFHFAADTDGEFEVDENDEVALGHAASAIVADRWDDGSFYLIAPPSKDVTGYAPSGQAFKFCSSGEIEDAPSNPQEGERIASKNRKASLENAIRHCKAEMKEIQAGKISRNINEEIITVESKTALLEMYQRLLESCS